MAIREGLHLLSRAALGEMGQQRVQEDEVSRTRLDKSIAAGSELPVFVGVRL